jgi:hypothetical protein
MSARMPSRESKRRRRPCAITPDCPFVAQAATIVRIPLRVRANRKQQRRPGPTVVRLAPDGSSPRTDLPTPTPPMPTGLMPSAASRRDLRRSSLTYVVCSLTRSSRREPVRDNHSLHVLQKQADGRWLIVSEMFMDARQDETYTPPPNRRALPA